MKKLLFFLSIVTLIFAGCSDDDDEGGTPTIEGTELSGDITSDVQLDASVTYTLNGTLSIKDGATLIIPAGTTIKATKGFSSYLIVEQGGKIDAEGTANNPITFTSAESSPARGDWGGIWLNGYAPLSGGGTGTAEVDNTIPYGGSDETDNSGIMKYVIIAYSGAQSSESVEHNGLTLDAVGSGTTIENIYVYEGADDAIEFFGGTVNVTNLLAVNCDDDMFDLTQGWSGTLDNAYGIWETGYTSSESDPRGIEADGNLDGNYSSQSGQSDFTMSNITIQNASSYIMEDGIKIRRGATATIQNALIIGGEAKDLIDMTDSKGDASTTSSISLTKSTVGYTTNEIHTSDTYDDVIIESGNTGADASAFDWTGYDFAKNEYATVSGELSGNLTENTTLDPSTTEYTLNGTLSIKDGATLFIPAGTTIKATSGFSSYLIVEQGGRIIAQGNADAPIIFTSAASTPEAADWGGIWLNGYASVSGGGTGTAEVDNTIPYGGDDDSDNSGILSYVKILYSGAQSSESVEHNGLTLDAVGNGTVINNIYVAEGGDDAIEFFGGTVNVTNLMAVNCDDDMFDLTQGWSGTLDNAYGVWESGFTSSESDPNGIEADGNLDGNYSEQSGQSDFTMKNITIVNNSAYIMNDGMRIRRGATATITNALIKNGVATAIIDLTDSKGGANTNTAISLTVDGMTVDGGGAQIKATDTFSNVVIEAGNTGATTSEFDWTGYNF